MVRICSGWGHRTVWMGKPDIRVKILSMKPENAHLNLSQPFSQIAVYGIYFVHIILDREVLCGQRVVKH